MTIQIIIADGHQLVRKGLRSILSIQHDFRICSEASDGLQAVEQVTQLMPDVLILDLMLPGLNGLDVTREIRHIAPHVHVIILSIYSNEAYVLEALKNGAAGYVLKDSSTEELIDAVHTVMEGQRYLSPCVSEFVINAYIRKTQHSKANH